MRTFVWTTITISFILVALALAIALPIMCRCILPDKPVIKQRISYIPVVRDEHQVDLIHGRDTIKIYLENAYALQEEYVVFVEQ